MIRRLWCWLIGHDMQYVVVPGLRPYAGSLADQRYCRRCSWWTPYTRSEVITKVLSR